MCLSKFVAFTLDLKAKDMHICENVSSRMDVSMALSEEVEDEEVEV